MNINFPPDITNINAKAWYMQDVLGMSLDEIGLELGYAPSSVRRVVNGAYQRQTKASIYKKQVEYCKNICKDSTENCQTCHLFNFILKKLIKKEQKRDGVM